ncbi:hypothetical protein Hte_000278 [Hypoxylon texense]
MPQDNASELHAKLNSLWEASLSVRAIWYRNANGKKTTSEGKKRRIRATGLSPPTETEAMGVDTTEADTTEANTMKADTMVADTMEAEMEAEIYQPCVHVVTRRRLLHHHVVVP